MLSCFWLSRTPLQTEGPITAGGLGAVVSASVDLVELGSGGALVLRLRGEATWLRGTSRLLKFDGGQVVPRAALMLGVRL